MSTSCLLFVLDPKILGIENKEQTRCGQEISRLLETVFWTQSDLQSIHTSLPQYPCMTTGDACGYVVLAELVGQYQAGAGPRDGGGWPLKGCAAATQPGQSCYPDNIFL